MAGIVPTFVWIGSALRHINSNSNRDVLDFRLAGSGSANRWNSQDQSTLYLAGDEGVVIAEWGRHIAPRLADGIDGFGVSHREVFSLKLRIDRVADIRNPETATGVLLFDLSHDLLDLKLTRSAANIVRSQSDAQAMLVPSIAFLDDPTRWNLVVFLEKMPADTASWITGVTNIGPLRWN